MKKQMKTLFAAAPLLVYTAVLVGLLLLRILFNATLPGWSAWAVGIGWGLMAAGYLLHAELFKQIGGFVAALLAALILTGALIPQEQVSLYPRLASDQLVQEVESTWNSLYQGNLFEHYSLKQQLLDYGASFAQLDPFRTGKMILFGLLGFALAVCYLFPVEPPGTRLRRRAWAAAENPGRLDDLNVWRAYLRRFGLIFIAGSVFALQTELLQVLSPTRMVTLRSMFDSCAGLLIGLLLFVPVHLFYLFLAEHRAKGSPRFNVLGVGVDAVNMSDCLKLFEEIISDGVAAGNLQSGVSESLSTGNPQRSTPNCRHRPAMTSALGVAGIMEARRNPKMQRILNESVLNTPDGMPLVWLGKLFGYQQIERVYGPDLLREVCAYSASRGWRHFFYGAAPGIVEKLKAELERKYPEIQIAGIYCPPFRPLTPDEEAALIAQVAEAKPDIFWIGISTPKQLYFMDQMRDKLSCKILCPVGYAFDVNAGVQEDAPDWAKYSGFQWLHRAIKQPRLWKRYLPDNPRFVVESALQILHLKKYPMFVHERPVKPVTDAEGYPRFPAGAVSLSAMTLHSARDRVLQWVATGRRHYVNICTADTMVHCFDQPQLAKIVHQAGMATTDGMPLVWLAHYYGFKKATRVYGPDLMLELCRSTAEPFRPLNGDAARVGQNAGGTRPVSHFFYGATDEVLAQLKSNLLEKFPGLQIAGMYSPPFRPLTEIEKAEVAERINASGADIVWCGLGTPKQDYWVAEFRPRLHCAAILAVGAAFNFHSGHVRQAPRWMMHSGLEWLFRLCIEPRRLWRRYLIGNVRFVLLAAGQLLRSRK